MKERDIYSLDIVLIGSFNPVIITPFWLSLKGLIREVEAETAKVEVIHSDITRFEFDWLSFEATQTRLEFKTNRESHFDVLKDLIVSIFGFLKETPITACGINHLCHFSLKSFEEYKNFGFWLSPVQELNNVLNDPRVLSVHYTESKNEENTDNGLIRLIISPSDLIHDSKSVLINFNHHFQNKKGDAKNMIGIISDKWTYSFEKANAVINELWLKAKL